MPGHPGSYRHSHGKGAFTVSDIASIYNLVGGSGPTTSDSLEASGCFRNANVSQQASNGPVRTVLSVLGRVCHSQARTLDFSVSNGHPIKENPRIYEIRTGPITGLAKLNPKNRPDVQSWLLEIKSLLRPVNRLDGGLRLITNPPQARRFRNHPAAATAKSRTRSPSPLANIAVTQSRMGILNDT
jgi:hypothetical protein